MVMLYKQLAVLAASEGPAKGWGRGPGAMVPRSALPPASPQYYYGGVEKAGQGAITSHAGPAAAGKLQGLSPQGRTRAEAAKVCKGPQPRPPCCSDVLTCARVPSQLLVRQLRDQAALQGERDELAHKCSALQRQVERMRAEAQGAEAAAKATAGEGGGAGERGDDALAGLGREDLIEALRELKRDGGCVAGLARVAWVRVPRCGRLLTASTPSSPLQGPRCGGEQPAGGPRAGAGGGGRGTRGARGAGGGEGAVGGTRVGGSVQGG